MSEASDQGKRGWNKGRELLRISPNLTFDTAGSMKSVWNAPATASGTVILAPKSGLAIDATTLQAALLPLTA